MMFTELNASRFDYDGIFYNAEFEDILSKIITCYNLMLSNNITLSNDENQIRDVLYLNYLNCDTIRNSVGLLSYYFDRETQEDKTAGRTDIRILTANSFIETAAYYIIECKRLDATNPHGSTGLNAKYIKNGICRFTSKIYSTYYKSNGMIGFVVEPMDIYINITYINNLLKKAFPKANTIQELTYREIKPDFEFSYCSFHNSGKDKVLLYHLMFNYSKNIKP